MRGLFIFISLSCLSLSIGQTQDELQIQLDTATEPADPFEDVRVLIQGALLDRGTPLAPTETITSLTRGLDGRFYGYLKGAVLTWDPGSGKIEVFARGFRHVHGLAFDASGNLFALDDGRLYVIHEGMDAGWHEAYQSRESGYASLPPLAQFSKGSVDGQLLFVPETALGEAFAGHFLLTEPEKQRLLAFRVVQADAGYKVTNKREVRTNHTLTSIRLASDGGLIGRSEDGRYLKVDVVEDDRDSRRKGTQQILDEGMHRRPAGRLLDLLRHPDLRVRLAAQFEIVDRGDFTILRNTAVADSSDVARRHGIWGCAHLARKNPDETLQGLVSLLEHRNLGLRAQMLKAFGDTQSLYATDVVLKRLHAPDPRLQFEAAMALHHLAGPKHFDAITSFIIGNAGHPVLRHAGIRALAGAARSWPELLSDFKDDPSLDVRLAAVTAMRQLQLSDDVSRVLEQDPNAFEAVTLFLNDHDERVVRETAKAIVDVPQPRRKALEALAEMLKTNPRNEGIQQRAERATLLLEAFPSR